MSEKNRILIIGNGEMCRTNSEILQAEGYEVEAAQTGPGAAEQVRQTHYDLVIITTSASNTDAIELLKTIREVDPGIKAIVSSPCATTEDLVEAVEKGVFAYIPKPTSENRIATVVEKALSEAEQETEIFRGVVRVYRHFVAVIGEQDETLETWLRKRAVKYKDKSIKMILVADKED